MTRDEIECKLAENEAAQDRQMVRFAELQMAIRTTADSERRLTLKIAMMSIVDEVSRLSLAHSDLRYLQILAEQRVEAA